MQPSQSVRFHYELCCGTGKGTEREGEEGELKFITGYKVPDEKSAPFRSRVREDWWGVRKEGLAPASSDRQQALKARREMAVCECVFGREDGGESQRQTSSREQLWGTSRTSKFRGLKQPHPRRLSG